MKSRKIKTKDVVLLAMLTAIIFVQEQVLSFIPQFQFTILLLVLYSKCLGFYKTTIIITVKTFCLLTMFHVLLDNLVMGSLNYIYTPAMIIVWLFIPLLLNTVFKKINSPIGLALTSILFSLLYSWSFIPINVLTTDVDFFAYLIADIPFEIMLIVYSFLTIIWLYKPLEKVLKSLNDSYGFNNEEK